MHSAFQTHQSKIKFLTGAPNPDRVQTDINSTSLLESFVPAFRRYLDPGGVDIYQPATAESRLGSEETSAAGPKWRSVPLNTDEMTRNVVSPRRLDGETHTAYPGQGREPDMNKNNSFLSATSKREEGGGESFLEHSYSLFSQSNAGNLSNEQPASAETASATQDTVEISYMSTETSSLFEDQEDASGLGVQLPKHISTLKSLPQASHVLKIAPQTITVNLIVGVISLAEPRSIQLRHSSRSMDMVELVVGDNTSAGFSISFWLEPEEGKGAEKPKTVGRSRTNHYKMDLRESLGRIRCRDVVLLGNVALRVFQGRVYGQSLNAKVCRNETTVEIVDGEVNGDEEGIQRVSNVTTWTLNFLGPREKSEKSEKRERRVTQEAELPPDTLVEE